RLGLPRTGGPLLARAPLSWLGPAVRLGSAGRSTALHAGPGPRPWGLVAVAAPRGDGGSLTPPRPNLPPGLPGLGGWVRRPPGGPAPPGWGLAARPAALGPGWPSTPGMPLCGLQPGAVRG